MKTIYLCKNKDGYYLNIDSLKKLNGGKCLSKSQRALLGLKKVKMKQEDIKK